MNDRKTVDPQEVLERFLKDIAPGPLDIRLQTENQHLRAVIDISRDRIHALETEVAWLRQETVLLEELRQKDVKDYREYGERKATENERLRASLRNVLTLIDAGYLRQTQMSSGTDATLLAARRVADERG